MTTRADGQAVDLDDDEPEPVLDCMNFHRHGPTCYGLDDVSRGIYL